MCLCFLSGCFIFGILQFNFEKISFTYPDWDLLCFFNLNVLVFNQFWKILSIFLQCLFFFFFFLSPGVLIKPMAGPHNLFPCLLIFHISSVFGLLSVISLVLYSSLLILSSTVCNLLFNQNIDFGFNYYIFLFLEVLFGSFSEVSWTLQEL